MYVSKTGVFSGEADVAQAEISGSFEGNLRARNGFFLAQTGTFRGVLDAKLAKIDAGSCIEGEIRIQGDM